MLRIFSRCLCLGACLLSAAATGLSQDKAAPKKSKIARLDVEGFPLPAGAVARLGTLRGVDPEPIHVLAISADGKKVATLPQGPNPTLRIREVPSGKLLQEIRINDPDLGPPAASGRQNSQSLTTPAGKPELRAEVVGASELRQQLAQNSVS